MTKAMKRIDYGIPRGPKGRAKLPHRRNPEGIAEAIPAGLNVDAVLQRYLSAPTSSTIARELGVRRSTLTKWLRDTAPEKWKAVQVIRADLRKEDGDEGIYGARDALELARARELLKSAQWDLERLDSANYSEKVEHASQIQPVLVIQVVVPGEERVIDANAPATIEEKS